MNKACANLGFVFPGILRLPFFRKLTSDCRISSGVFRDSAGEVLLYVSLCFNCSMEGHLSCALIQICITQHKMSGICDGKYWLRE